MLGLVDYGSSDDEDSAPVTHDEHDEHVPTTTIRTITTSSSTTITSKRIERDDNRKDNERKRDRCEGESHQDSSTSTRPKVVECRSFQNNINNRNENVTTNSSNSSSDMPAIRPNNNVERSSKFIPTSEILQTKSASDFHEFVKLYNLDEVRAMNCVLSVDPVSCIISSLLLHSI